LIREEHLFFSDENWELGIEHWSDLFLIFLLLHVPLQRARADFGAVYVAAGVGSDAFGGARGWGLLDRIGDEGLHGAVLGAADADAALPAVVIAGDGFGFGIRDVDDVILIDVNSARPAELLPLVDEFPVLVEDLNSIVVPVADEEPAL